MTLNNTDKTAREAMEITLQTDGEQVRENEAEDMTCMSENVCACCRHKNTPRDEREQKKLNSRINRIIGQLNGIQNMIEDNRYCGDILIQIGAVESALQGLGYQILQEHMESCVVEEVKRGNTAIMSEAVELMKRLK